MGASDLEGADERSLIEQVPREKGDLLAQVSDAGIVGLGDAADEAEELVALLEEELRQVAAILSRDPRDQCPLLLAHPVSLAPDAC